MGSDNLSQNDLLFLGITPNQETGTYSQKINYFIVPALLKYNFKNRIYLEGGPQLGLMHNAWVEFNSDVDGKSIRIRETNKNNINRLDAGVSLGTGYKLMNDKGMSIGVKYYYGFTNVYKGISGTNNSSLFLKLNIPIGAAKAETKNKD